MCVSQQELAQFSGQDRSDTGNFNQFCKQPSFHLERNSIMKEFSVIYFVCSVYLFELVNTVLTRKSTGKLKVIFCVQNCVCKRKIGPEKASVTD